VISCGTEVIEVSHCREVISLEQIRRLELGGGTEYNITAPSHCQNFLQK
jgi:hypothetical protein